ncbi:phage tail protein [Flavobacterium aquiphilum]|uniref:phage tail protein n=1 Tax=Flavobacterium aquiphilum TaxID=3003261 RepID=UPI0024801BA4|nr:tail fiber protein [Flavobacterium aquiphilum]
MDFFASQIICLATNVSPKGFMKCEGQTLKTADYPALFSVIGINYGGNGTTNFKLPDLRDRSIVHQSASKALGSFGGSSSITLTEDNLPQHTHTLNNVVVKIKASTANADEVAAEGNYPAVSGSATYSGNGPTTGTYTGETEIFGTINNAGSDSTVDIQNPYLAMSYFISLYGVLPVQE